MAFIRTGSLGLDLLLGGGWERGHIHEIWGEPGSGKTTLAEHAVWELERDEEALWISLGTEVPHRPARGYVSQPRSAEQAFYIMETFVGGVGAQGKGSLVVVDSANGLIRQAELDGDEDYVPDPHREYKDELTSLKRVCRATKGTVIFLSKPRNRERQPIRGTGISEKARSRVKLSIGMKHQDESRLIEARVKEESCTFIMRPGTGIDWGSELAKLAIEYGFAERDGSWINSNHETFHGFQAFAWEIENNTRLAIALDEQIRHVNLSKTICP